MIIADADDDEDQKTTMMTTTTTGRPDGCSLGLFWGPSPGRRAIIVNGFARECTIIFCLFFFAGLAHFSMTHAKSAGSVSLPIPAERRDATVTIRR